MPATARAAQVKFGGANPVPLDGNSQALYAQQHILAVDSAVLAVILKKVSKPPFLARPNSVFWTAAKPIRHLLLCGAA